MRTFSLKEFILILFGLFLLGSIIFRFTDPVKNPLGIGSDSYEFWHLSTNLLEKKIFAYTDLKHYPLFFLGDNPPPELLNQTVFCTTRVPGYPLILAIARSFWNSPQIAIGLNILAYVGICLYGFLLGRILLKRDQHRLIFNIFLTFSPLYFIRWGVGADFIAGLFLTGFTFHLLKAIHSDSQKFTHLCWISILGLSAILTRPNLLIFILGLTCLLVIWKMIEKQYLNAFRLFLILLLIIFGTKCWMERNKNLTGQRILSTQGGVVLYTVHLAPHIDETNPLFAWSKQNRRELFIKQLRTGKTFNQSEVIINDQVKAITINFLKKNPALLITNTIDCLRTFFLFSYYDISDILIYSWRPMEDRMQYLETEHFQPINAFENHIHQILFQISRFYKIGLAFGFFAFPLLLLFKKLRVNLKDTHIITLLYLTTFLSVISTAFFTGAGGDRLRMPFNIFILLFAVVFWCQIFRCKSKS